MLAGGMVIFAEGLTLCAVEFVFEGDTSDIPSTWYVFEETAKGIYFSLNPCNK